MKLSTRGRYGLRAMHYLAENKDKGYISVSDMAKSLSLSESYLEQLIRTLKKDGIIKSIRGSKGGYALKKDPGDVTVGMILRSLEGDFSLSNCSCEDLRCNDSCKTRDVFHKIDEAIDKAVNSITLQDMLDDDSKERQ